MREQVNGTLRRQRIPAQPRSIEEAPEVAQVMTVGQHGVGRAAAGGEMGEEVARDRHGCASIVQDLDRAMPVAGNLGVSQQGHGAPPQEQRCAPKLPHRPSPEHSLST